MTQIVLQGNGANGKGLGARKAVQDEVLPKEPIVPTVPAGPTVGQKQPVRARLTHDKKIPGRLVAARQLHQFEIETDQMEEQTRRAQGRGTGKSWTVGTITLNTELEDPYAEFDK